MAGASRFAGVCLNPTGAWPCARLDPVEAGFAGKTRACAAVLQSVPVLARVDACR
jgi:hypothetical protein